MFSSKFYLLFFNTTQQALSLNIYHNPPHIYQPLIQLKSLKIFLFSGSSKTCKLWLAKKDVGGESLAASMKIREAVVAPRRNPVGHVHNKVGHKNGNRVIKKRRCDKRKGGGGGVRRPPMALQRLFESCKDVFRGPGTVPLPLDVEKMCHLLDDMKPDDFGLSSDLQFFQPKTEVEGTPRVTYTTIYKCDNFSLCLFFLPANAKIPLHNHPEMTVFSKLILGTMHIKSYDLVNPPFTVEAAKPSHLRLARLVADDDFTAPCSTSVLYPTTGGNIHEFTAVTPCAVLDVLGPPYSKEDGRDCSYYKDYPFPASPSEKDGLQKNDEVGSYGWLVEIEMPEDSQMDGIEYLGPQLVTNNV